MTTTTPPVSQPMPDAGQAGRPEPGLPARLAALETLLRLGAGRVDQALLDDAGALLNRAGQRLRLSGDHTVAALAGGTGSGKSSLFNAVCGLELSPVGLRRPMTSAAHACVWGLDGAGPLLDWLGVDKRYRYARATAQDTDGPSMRGLVLLDLPDHDSIQARHRAEADRFVAIADLLVWVLDPQKYADAALHRNYIVPFAEYAAVTLIVLNQIDRLQAEEVADCVADLRRLLQAEGLDEPRILTTSATSGEGVSGFRDVLIDTVAARRARLERLTADVDRLVERFTGCVGTGRPPATVDERRASALVDALTDAAGVPAVAEAMESAYELRAVDYVGWPVGRLAARLRTDPLRKMRLSELSRELRGAFTGPVGAQQGEVDNALHGVTDGVTTDLPEAWQRSVRQAGRSHAEELPDTLGQALREAIPGFNQIPGWWRLARVWQYVLLTVSVMSVVWLVLLTIFGVFAVGEPPSTLVADTVLMPYVGLLLFCTLGLGMLSSSACRNVAALTSARHGERMEGYMRDRIATVAREHVLEPVADELEIYASFQQAFRAARAT